MKNSQTKFQIADESAAPETTNAMEVAVTETETHDVAVVSLPDGVDLASIMAKASLLGQAEIAMTSIKAEYLELNLGETFRGVFMGFGIATHKNPNAGAEGENGLVEKKCIKIIGSDKKAYINSSVLLVRDCESLSVGSAIQDTNLNNNEFLKNVTTSEEALKIMSDMIDFQTTRKKTKRLTEVGIVALIENEDYKFRPEGTFSRANEIIVMLDEINSYLDKTKPPAELKVITQTGSEFTGKEAYKELSEFMSRITDEMRKESSVAAMFFLPYKYVSPFFIVDLREFDENNQKNFITLDSALPQSKSAA